MVDIGRGVITGVVGFITIVFLTLFMILEGPTWVERGLGLMPQASRPRWRNVGHRIAQTVSGYVTGNLLLSVIAGVVLDDRAADHGRPVRARARAGRRRSST